MMLMSKTVCLKGLRVIIFNHHNNNNNDDDDNYFISVYPFSRLENIRSGLSYLQLTVRDWF